MVRTGRHERIKAGYIIYLFLLSILLMAGCQHRSRLTPWGDVIGDTAQQTAHFSFDEMLMHGEMILLVISSPDTYYDYHGRDMGLQYHLCQLFANHLGVSLRADICRDTTELFERLRRGEGDIAIALGADSIARQLKPVREVKSLDIGDTQWYLRANNEELQKELRTWYDEGQLTMAQAAEKQGHLPQPRSYHFDAPILNAPKGIISRYDALFQRYASLAHTDWRLLAALSYQESKFNPTAVSWAGAKGLMQLMPATARQLGITEGNIFDPATNIEGGARTLGSLQALFIDIFSTDERLNFALASYNGGYGHIRDAMRLAAKHGHNARRWSEVADYVLALSEPLYYNDPVVRNGYMRGTETVNYVRQVRQRYDIYRGAASSQQYPSVSYPQRGSNPSQRSSGSYEDNSVPRRATNSHRFQL